MVRGGSRDGIGLFMLKSHHAGGRPFYRGGDGRRRSFRGRTEKDRRNTEEGGRHRKFSGKGKIDGGRGGKMTRSSFSLSDRPGQSEKGNICGRGYH